MIVSQLFICSLLLFVFLKPVYLLVQFEVNPDCSLSECSQANRSALYYGTTDIGDDSIHIFYSSFDELTISLLQTKTGHRPTINYTALFHGSYANAIQFDDISPVNSMSIIIRRLMAYSDSDDTATLKDNDQTIQSIWLSNLTTNFTDRNQTVAQPNFQLPLNNVNSIGIRIEKRSLLLLFRSVDLSFLILNILAKQIVIHTILNFVRHPRVSI